MSKKRMLTVIKWPNGFYQLIKVLDEQHGGLIEQEINSIADDYCTQLGTLRSDIKIRVFEVSSIKTKDKL